MFLLLMFAHEVRCQTIPMATYQLSHLVSAKHKLYSTGGMRILAQDDVIAIYEKESSIDLLISALGLNITVKIHKVEKNKDIVIFRCNYLLNGSKTYCRVVKVTDTQYQLFLNYRRDLDVYLDIVTLYKKKTWKM